VWWISAGSSYKALVDAGQLWSPNTDKAGRRDPRYTLLQQVKKGDVLVCNVDRSIVAVLLATSDAVPAPRPNLKVYANWAEQGTSVEVEYKQLELPVDVNPIKEQLISLNGSNKPFDRTGRFRQGFIFELGDEGLQMVHNASKEEWPSWAILESEEEDGEDNALWLSSELQPLLLMLKYNPNVILYGPPGTGKTRLVQLLQQHVEELAAAKTEPAPAPSVSNPRFFLLITNDATTVDGQLWQWQGFVAKGSEFFNAKRRFAAAFEHSQVGDIVFCYRAYPIKALAGLARVEQALHSEAEEGGVEEKGVTIKLTGELAHPVPWSLIKERLSFRPNDVQATLRQLTDEQAATLLQLCQDAGNADLPLSEEQESALQEATEPPVARTAFVTFHQSFAYEDFVEGLRPESKSGQLSYNPRPGVFKRICADAAAHPDEQHLLVVDEINRANIAKVFGELITLIEQDKRLGKSAALQVILPYSGEPFGVPPNLWIVGTMNTADRSIALLDIALRRRFNFLPLLPDPATIAPQMVADVDLHALLTSLNERVEVLAGADYLIGHSYFIGISNLAQLRSVWYNKVIPLLQEYFYNDWQRLRAVLGKQFITAQPLSAKLKKQLAEALAADDQLYRINHNLTDEAFTSALRVLIDDGSASGSLSNSDDQSAT